MRTVEKQEIFLRYGIASQIDPKKLTGGMTRTSHPVCRPMTGTTGRASLRRLKM